MRCLEPTNALTSASTLSALLAPPARSPLDELACRARAGDAAAGESLFRHLLVRLRPLVARAARGLSPADVEDLVQEIAVAAWEVDLHRYDPARGSFLVFVGKRLRWRVADHRRKLARRRADSLEARLSSGAAEPEDALARPDDKIALQAREATLLRLPSLLGDALDGMRDGAAKAALVQHDLQGKALTEVARSLGVHASNACRARKRALEHLQRTLPEEARAAA